MIDAETGLHRKRGLNLAGLLLFQTLAVSILYWPVVSGKAVFFQRDILNYWKPHVDWILKSLASGQTIGWNPGLMFGVPMLADPNLQLFYPPTWLIALAAPTTAYALLVIGHSFWGALGVHRLLRDRGETSGAIAGALIFTLSGPFISLGSLWHHYCGAAWIPWVLWAAERVARTQGTSWRPLALTLGLQALAGSAESVMMAICLAVIPLALSREKTRLIGLARAGVVAFGLCAIQWIPTAILVGQSARSAFSSDVKLYWSVNPELAHETLIPGRRPAPVVLSGSAPPGDDDVRLLESFYLGAASLPLLLLGLSRNRALATVGLLLFVVSLGKHLGETASQVLAVGLPFRYPSKLLAGVAVAWAIVCGSGVHRALTMMRPGFGRLSGGVLVVLTPAVLFLLVPDFSNFDQRLLRAAVFVLAAMSLLPAPSRLRSVGIPLLLMADLLPPALFIHSFSVPTVPLYRPPVVDAILAHGKNPRVFAAEISEAWTQADLYRRGQRSETALHLAMSDTLQSLAIGFGVRYGFHSDFTGLGSRDASAFQDFVKDRFRADLPRYLDLGAIDAVVSYGATNPLGTPKGDVELPGLLTEPTRVDYWGRVPRASMAARVEARPNTDLALQWLATPTFRPGYDVVIEAQAPLQGAAVVSEGSTARITFDSNDRVDVEANTTGPGWLVLRDSYRNGWSASVNGVETRIEKADVLFRAVAVPPGRSVVSFSYQTPGLRAGALLGLLSLIAVLVGAVERPHRTPSAAESLPESAA